MPFTVFRGADCGIRIFLCTFAVCKADASQSGSFLSRTRTIGACRRFLFCAAAAQLKIPDMDHIKVKIINRSHHPLPAYGTPEAAGMDVRAFLPEGSVTLRPMERALISTGLYMQLPSGYECQIRPRSGLALKKGITIANSPGTVDADYRGEIGIILLNLGTEDFVVNDGDRICQMVIKQYSRVGWEEVKELDRTKREDGAFGHTGTE